MAHKANRKPELQHTQNLTKPEDPNRMTNSLAGKVVIVSGGFSGIGLATVHNLLLKSATVHAVDIAPSAPQSVPEGNIHFYPSVDISKRKDVAEVFAAILARSPVVDGLVNCAGISPITSDIIETDDMYMRIMDVNCTGMWMLGTEFLKYIMATSTPGAEPRRTSIVGIGSTASFKGYPALTAYTCSKHAMLGLIRSWATGFARSGVRANLIAPGGTITPMFKSQVAGGGVRAEAVEVAKTLVPMGRWGEPEEIANGIVFLLSDESSYVTGQVLGVNGGEA
jgi:NAD(P)-dependent dehydrogenase (short-subunit alcohol dehydrogenase family)